MEINTELELPISITSSALKEMRMLMSKELEKETEKALRIGVKGGGCAGYSYLLEFDEVHEKDNTYVLEGLTLVIESSHEELLKGMELDFKNGLNNRGFVFNNPNAKTTCGCGTSFAV